ncbi:MAG: helix-turn-helix domain-containing protein [Spirochaetaceae bacterium]|jgi:transcriptional regulator with XRE-family HTH domain|nr:helix-turn-helix domain-containing protein [Spirochaetaceae bacterium]
MDESTDGAALGSEGGGEGGVIEAQVKRLVERLKLERLRAGFSQGELSERAGLSQNMISYIETGKVCPTVATIFKMCGALSLAPHELFSQVKDETERSAVREKMLELINNYF